MLSVKYLATLAVAMNIGMMGICHAFTAGDYTEILRGGKYHIEYVMAGDSLVNIESGKKGTNNCVLIQDLNGKILYEKNAYFPNSEYPYYYQKIVQDGVERYYAEKYDKKKEIDIQKVKLKKNKQSSRAGKVRYDGIYDVAVMEIDEFLSMLGKISEDANLLPNYKVNLLRSGQEELNGSRYDVEEYEIVVPYHAKLKLYYLNGNLVKSIKIMDDAWVGHRLFSDIKVKREGYVAVDIKRFDSNVDATVFAVKK